MQTGCTCRSRSAEADLAPCKKGVLRIAARPFLFSGANSAVRSVQQVGLLPDDALVKRLERHPTAIRRAQLLAREHCILVVDHVRHAGGFRQQLHLSGPFHGDEPSRRLVDGLADGEVAVVDHDHRLVLSQGAADAIAFDDGTVTHLIGNAKPLLNPSGEIYGAVAAFVDICARKAAEDRIQADGPPGPADTVAEPDPADGPPRSGAGDFPAQSPAGGRDLPRPRQFQGHQRPPGPSRRGSGAATDSRVDTGIHSRSRYGVTAGWRRIHHRAA